MHILVIWLLSLGHLVVDTGQGIIPVLLPVLKHDFHLSYAAVGAVTLVTNLSSSVVQPLFGVLSDRVPSRWLLPAGCLLTALGLVLAGCAPHYAFVLLGVFLSGLGIAGYHPEGSRNTFFVARGGRAASMAVYALGGNVGFALGPLLATALLAPWGRSGVAGYLVPAALTALLLWLALPAVAGAAREREEAYRQVTARCRASGEAPARVPWGAVGLLTGVVTLRSFIHAGVVNYIPLYFTSHLGLPDAYGGRLLTVFLLAGALGTLTGGPFADRWGRRRLLLLSFLTALPLLALFPRTAGLWQVALLFGAGFAVIASFPVTVVLAQELMPQNVGLASGLMLGFAVGMGGVGAPLLGAVADHWGVPAALDVIALLPIPAFLLSLFLPRERKRKREEDKETGA
ncbi:MAG: MFS transporter [Bacillota bacterium]